MNIRRNISRTALLLAALLLGGSGAAGGQAVRTEYEGATALGLELRRLGTSKRVLMIGAHPDDESTQILSSLALGQGADVAYLSLTRGEGGQNGIGPELQEGLGLVRSEELLAARRLDGAQQFFTRAYDFGFSKNADEAFRHWPRDSVLADVVAVIRHFRPDVVISVFSGTPRDGHGQHQVAGILAREAFAAAGDPARFPEQLSRGLRPFAPRKFYLSLWSGDAQAQAELPTGAYDPLFGRSHFQVAMASRSRHRSQDMGQILTPGPRSSRFRLVAVNGAPVEPSAGIFAGIDTTLAQRLSGPRVPARVATLLGSYQERASAAARTFNPLAPGEAVPALAQALDALASADSLLGTAEGDPSLRFHLDVEREQTRSALWQAAGLVLDALADDETVVPGQPFRLTLSLWNGGERAVRVRRLEPELPTGWSVEAEAPLAERLEPGELLTRTFRVSVPAGAAPTRPYFLRRSRNGDLYAWPEDVRVGLPFEPSPVGAVAEVEVREVEVGARRDATFRDLDKRQGELRRPVRVVPAVALRLEPGLSVLPLQTERAGAPQRFTVRVRSEAPGGLGGSLRLSAPAGWTVQPASVPVRFATPGEERSVEFVLEPPAGIAPGEASIRAVFEDQQGRRFTEGYDLVDYPHIRPRALYAPAEARLRAFEVRLPGEMRVGYVAGAGDDTEGALRRLGIPVRSLSAEDLATGDLSGFDAIITGIRAYEVRPDLLAHNQRLLDYARQGGTLVVQYNKYEFAQPGIAPYPVEMSRPHDRVTDEEAAVRLLAPDHPALSWPNRITAADFEGWVQERGLYFLHRWDDRFVPLLEMADPGQAPQRGALLVAPYGEGTYVYTGLSLFRQLPEGVPGAYRLLVNLLSMGMRK